MKELYEQLGISSRVYDFGAEIEKSLKDRFDWDEKEILKYMTEILEERGILKHTERNGKEQ